MKMKEQEQETEKINNIDYEQKKRYSLDTCVIRNILENPNYLSCMKMHIDFEDSMIFLSETAIWEIEKQLGEINYGLTTDTVIQKIRDGLNADITILENSKETKIMADDLLLVNQPDLHYPDNLHLAFSITQKTTLLSCDSKLVRCCKREGHPCINPNKLVSDSTQMVRGSSDDLIENSGLGKMPVCITRKQSCFRRRQR
jgi:PIN domain nuclease of toxin-antitoxin system